MANAEQYSSDPHTPHHPLGTAQVRDGVPDINDEAALRLEFDLESDFDEVEYLPTVCGGVK